MLGTGRSVATRRRSLTARCQDSQGSCSGGKWPINKLIRVVSCLDPFGRSIIGPRGQCNAKVVHANDIAYILVTWFSSSSGSKLSVRMRCAPPIGQHRIATSPDRWPCARRCWNPSLKTKPYFGQMWLRGKQSHWSRSYQNPLVLEARRPAIPDTNDRKLGRQYLIRNNPSPSRQTKARLRTGFTDVRRGNATATRRSGHQPRRRLPKSSVGVSQVWQNDRDVQVADSRRPSNNRQQRGIRHARAQQKPDHS